MSDAIGGVVNIALIVFFIVTIAMYMAFNVNYEKAFNVKNEIVSLYEEYEGTCTSECKQKIEDYEKKMGYTARNLSPDDNDGKERPNEHCFSTHGYCVRGITAKKNTFSKSETNENVQYCYFDIRTQVLVDMPIIDNLMGLQLFRVTGQTRTMKIYTTKTCDAIARTTG